MERMAWRRQFCVWSSCCFLLLNLAGSEAFVSSMGQLGSALPVLRSRLDVCPAALALKASSGNSEDDSSSPVPFSRRNALQLLSTAAASIVFPADSTAQGALDAKAPTAGPQQQPAGRPQKVGDTKDVLSGSAPSAIRKGQAAQSTNRNRIVVPDSIKKKVNGPVIQFPQTVADLKGWNQTESGLYFKELTVGNGSSPKKGNVLEVNYIGSVCDVDKDGNYECAERTGEAEIYPSMPQGILKDSPTYDSSFDRGRAMKVRYGGAQLCKGLEEALADMKEGGSKLVFLVPELSFACPKGRVCVADIEVDQRLAFYIELISVGKASNIGN